MFSVLELPYYAGVVMFQIRYFEIYVPNSISKPLAVKALRKFPAMTCTNLLYYDHHIIIECLLLRRLTLGR